MNIINKIALVSIIALAGMAIVTSCSKEPETASGGQGGKTPSTVAQKSGAKGQTKAEKAAAAKAAAKAKTAAKAAKMDAAIKAGPVFTGTGASLESARGGQYVNLKWRIDAAADKIDQIALMRSSLGASKSIKIAELSPDTTNFKDCLPDENAYWYWLVLESKDDKKQEFGPVKVEPDKAGSSNYIRQGDKYDASVTRTDDLATIKWEFPDADYKSIRIVRNTRPVADPFKGSSTPVLTALVRKSQFENALQNANSEYWYWFQITLKSGAIIYKGPIKAEYGKPARAAKTATPSQ